MKDDQLIEIKLVGEDNHVKMYVEFEHSFSTS